MDQTMALPNESIDTQVWYVIHSKARLYMSEDENTSFRVTRSIVYGRAIVLSSKVKIPKSRESYQETHQLRDHLEYHKLNSSLFPA